MRYLSLFLIISLTIVISNPLLGQEDTLGTLGLGISIDPTKGSELVYVESYLDDLQYISTTSTSAVVFYVPINVTNRYRLEPSIGIFSTSSSTTQGSGSPYTISNDASVITLGIRGTYRCSLSNSLILYFGPRLEFGIVSSTYEYVYITNVPNVNTKQDDKTITKETDITFGGVIGTEYFPIPKFSIGGEIGLNYVTFGNPDVTYNYYPTPATSNSTSEREQHTFFTGALFFLRWYFF